MTNDQFCITINIVKFAFNNKRFVLALSMIEVHHLSNLQYSLLIIPQCRYTHRPTPSLLFK